MAVVLCMKCSWRVVILTEIPTKCPKCGGKEWKSADEPTRPYAISVSDRRFLRSFRISPD